MDDRNDMGAGHERGGDQAGMSHGLTGWNQVHLA